MTDPANSSDKDDMLSEAKASQEEHEDYWKINLRYLAVLLLIWAAVSFGLGILLADELNTIRLGGFKLGFWFAQQGSIYVFVILIFVYAWLMNRLDHRYHVDEDNQSPEEPVNSH